MSELETNRVGNTVPPPPHFDQHSLEFSGKWIDDVEANNISYSDSSVPYSTFSEYFNQFTNISFKLDSFNSSMSEVYNIFHEHTKESYLSPNVQLIFMISYVTLIVFGTVSNIIVSLVIIKKHKRNSSDLYLVNLAFSDLTLGFIGMPFTLSKLMKKNYGLGNFTCKLIPVIQCTNILVSTFTIAAIAMDRYINVVRTGARRLPQRYYQISVAAIWIVSLLFAMPLFMYYSLETVRMQHATILYQKCGEVWPSRSVQLAWLTTFFLIHYTIPTIVLVFFHIKIKNFLKNHTMNNSSASRKQKELDRNRRASIILATISGVFALSWLPWHVANVLADFNFFQSAEVLYTVFGACHIVAMSTTCSNPILYGWLNTNLRAELRMFIAPLCKKVS